MNQDKILNMPAGREMDAHIGVYVLGYEMCSNGFCGQYHLEDGTSIYPKNWSTDISAAWEVVENLCNENGCDVVKVCKRDPELLRGEWSCNFGLGFEAFGETAPLAICRAALLVRGLTPRALDLWESARFTSIFLASGLSCSQAVTQPAHKPLTQPLACFLAWLRSVKNG